MKRSALLVGAGVGVHWIVLVALLVTSDLAPWVIVILLFALVLSVAAAAFGALTVAKRARQRMRTISSRITKLEGRAQASDEALRDFSDMSFVMTRVIDQARRR